jgi:hypothetical protein
VPNDDDNSNKKMIIDAIDCNNANVSHRGETRHSKNTREEESYNEKLILKLKAKIKEEFKKHNEEQLILLKENKQNIIDFIIDNKDSVRIEDLKIYEPIYKCFREKGPCFYCNTITNIICKTCNNNNYHNNKEVWLCTNHWQQHIIENH